MIRVILPKYFNLVVGDTFQLFYRSVIEAPNPYVYDILAVCEKGRNCPRYFEFTPDKAGEYELKIYVYSENKELLGYGATVLRAKIPEEPKRPINILCVGDSITTNGIWASEAYRRLTATDGEPKGLGFKNINFIGTMKRDEIGYEGYGGWIWKTFVTKNPNGVWFACEHSMDSADQHSTWRDENGKLWKLETLTQKNLKFLRLDKSDASYPAIGSFLTHVSDAVHTEPLKIIKYADEAKTPFYNPEKEGLDFEWYKKKCGIDSIDYIYVLLGGNEIADSPLPVNLSDPNSVVELCKRIIENAKEFINIMREAFPNVKLKIMGLTPPSQSGGMGASYGAKPPYCDKYGYTRFTFELNLLYEALCYEDGYSDFLEFVNIGAQFDSEYAYPAVDKPVNLRCRQIESIGTNGLHPTREGYLMIADAVFKNMANLD